MGKWVSTSTKLRENSENHNNKRTISEKKKIVASQTQPCTAT